MKHYFVTLPCSTMLLSFSQLRKKYSMDIKGIIHVGAHYGEEIGEYVNNGIQEIILFEPLSECFDILQRKIFFSKLISDYHFLPFCLSPFIQG